MRPDACDVWCRCPVISQVRWGRLCIRQLLGLKFKWNHRLYKQSYSTLLQLLVLASHSPTKRKHTQTGGWSAGGVGGVGSVERRDERRLCERFSGR